MAQSHKRKTAMAADHFDPITVKAPADEIDRWKKKAAAENRSLSSWIRLRLLALDAREATADPVVEKA